MPRKRGRRARAPAQAGSLKNKIGISWRNLVLFAILFAFSFLLYTASSSTFFLNLFGILAILFGFISFSLLVVLIILLVIKASRR